VHYTKPSKALPEPAFPVTGRPPGPRLPRSRRAVFFLEGKLRLIPASRFSTYGERPLKHAPICERTTTRFRVCAGLASRNQARRNAPSHDEILPEILAYFVFGRAKRERRFAETTGIAPEREWTGEHGRGLNNIPCPPSDHNRSSWVYRTPCHETCAADTYLLVSRLDFVRRRLISPSFSSMTSSGDRGTKQHRSEVNGPPSGFDRSMLP